METCHYCKKEIVEGDKEVILQTKKGNLIMQDLHFHYECWLNDYAESLDKKVKGYADKFMSFAKPAVEKVFLEKGLLG